MRRWYNGSASTAQIPAGDYFHCRLVPGGVGAVGRAAKAVGADFPPVDSLEPWLVVEALEDGFVAAGLVFGGELARGFIPGLAVRSFETGESGFGENDGFGELLVDGFDAGHGLGGGKVVGEGVVVVESDVIDGVPEAGGFEFGAEVGGVGELAGVKLTGALDEAAPFGFVAGEAGEFDTDGEEIGTDAGGEGCVVFEEEAVLLEPLLAVGFFGEVDVGGATAAEPELGFEEDFEAGGAGHFAQLGDGVVALHGAGAAETDGGLAFGGEAVGDEGDGVDAVLREGTKDLASAIRGIAIGEFGGVIDAALEGYGGRGGSGGQREEVAAGDGWCR